MKTCQYCTDDTNEDDERFCISCGGDMDASASGSPTRPVQQTRGFQTDNRVTISDELTLITWKNRARLRILDGKILTTLDDSYRLIGRADLRAHTIKDPDLISRSHFTVYKKDLTYIIKDGVTPVQDKPSKCGTLLNGDLLKTETTLKNGDTITVSDVEITFEA